MINTDVIRAAFVSKLREIPTLVSLLGGSSKIIEFTEDHRGDFFRRTIQLDPNELLVAYDGTEVSGSDMELWTHRFLLRYRPGSAAGSTPADVYYQIVEGIPSTGSLKMLYTPLMAGLHPMEIPTMQRQFIPTSPEASFNYWEITTAFTENRP